MVLVPVGESSVLEVDFDLSKSIISLDSCRRGLYGQWTYLVRHLIVNVFTAETGNKPNNTKSHGDHRHDTNTHNTVRDYTRQNQGQ